MAKRVREGKYKAFGDVLKAWRGDMEIQTVVRLVRHQGLKFDGATLRGWEYGWTGRPDPMRLLAVAAIYKKSTADVMKALASARGLTVQGIRSDLPGHTRTGQQSSHQEGDAVVPAPARVQQKRKVRNEELADEIDSIAGRLAQIAIALVEARTTRSRKASGDRGHRKTG